MTCDEFKQVTQKDILSSTRAERSAVGTHADNCPECRGWYMAYMMAYNPTPQELQEAWRFGELLLQQDKQDPEFS